MIFQEQDTGFPLTERDRLGLRGLLPPRVISFEQQYARFSKFEFYLLTVTVTVNNSIRTCFCGPF
jgi:hypothetical protein